MENTDPVALADAVRRLKKASVLVVGDAMLDRYCYGEASRISPEAPVPVVSVEREVAMPGGAGNVVRNLTALGAAVAFVSVIGDDQAGNMLTSLIGGHANVEPWLLVQGGRITTMKTRYIAGISHEIRSPLNSIYGYAQLLERGTTAPSENAVRVIRRSAEHLADLIDGILDISKIENGILRLNRDKVPLAEFLDQIVDMFRLQAAAKGIEFRYQRPPNLPGQVHVDQKRLRQILINLLSNAIKFTERGSATLTVRYRSQVAEFEVADTGVGIPANELERVFEPFERGQGASVRAIPGTGLGLTITKLLTQIMGGEINATST